MRVLAFSMFVALAAASWSAPARADGLRIGVGASAHRYADGNGNAVNVLSASTSARVSRGRAGISLAAPIIGIAGGSVTFGDQLMSVSGGESSTRWGLGDMAVGLDYNLVQNRERMFFLTLGGNLRFPTAAAGLGAGEHIANLGLSSYYGLTRNLFAFAEARQSWVAITSPLARRTLSGELGAVYWLTQSLGLTASVLGASFAGRAPPMLEFNVGLNVELLPGMMVNLGGVGGMLGGAPQAGGQFGFGFEL